MRYVVLALMILIPALATQINPWVGGLPTKVQAEGGYYVASTTSTLYIFNDSGLVNQLNLPGISDFSIKDGILVITLVTQDFPNIRAYSFPELSPLWDYEPKMEIFDPSLIWGKKQTRSWRVKPAGEGFGVTSGYTFYLFSETGELLGNFTVGSDIWDFAESGSEYLIATQKGSVYRLDSGLNLEKKEELCEPYTLLDEVSNKTVGTYSRSMWYISDRAAVCEDGFVYFLNTQSKYQLKKFTQSQLKQIYKTSKRESGYGSQNFENLKLKTSGSYTVAYTSESLAVFLGDNLVFDLTGSFSDVDIQDDFLYTLSMSRAGLETIKIYGLSDGKLKKTIETKGLDCDGQTYRVLGGKNLLIAGSCELKLITQASKVLWYLPTSSKLGSLSDGITVFFTGRMDGQSMPSFYSMMGYDKGVLWKYSLPDSLARKGSLTDLEVLGDTAVALYSRDDDLDGLVILYKNGTSVFRNGTNRKYAGDLDYYLSNATILKAVQNFSYGTLDGIPSEVKYGQNFSIGDYDPLQITLWLKTLNNLPMPVELMEQVRGNLQNLKDYALNSKIDSISTCDYDGDGIKDLLVVGDSYFSILSGANFSELIFKDQQNWRYSQSEAKKYTASWYNEGGAVLCLDDFSGDGLGELVIGTWSGNLSIIAGNKVKWNSNYKNLQLDRFSVIDDVDGDGIKDLLVQRWIQDKPSDIYFVSSVDGRQRAIFSANQYFYETNSDDIDGDNLNENILLYSADDLSVLEVFSPTYKFEYSGIKDVWSTWSEYGQVLPIEIISDYDGDGFKDLALGLSRKWGNSASALLIYSGKSKNLIDIISLDGDVNKDINEDEWQYFPEVKRFGDLLTFIIPAQDKGDQSSGGRLGVYNLTSNEVVAYFNHEIKTVVNYGDNMQLLGKNGEIYILNQTDFRRPEVSDDGSTVKVKSSDNYYTTIYVDGGIAGSGRKSEFSMRLLNGDHKVIVSLLSEDGFEKLFTYDVSTFTSTSLSFLNSSLIVILMLFGAYKVIRKWKSQ